MRPTRSSIRQWERDSPARLFRVQYHRQSSDCLRQSLTIPAGVKDVLAFFRLGFLSRYPAGVCTAGRTLARIESHLFFKDTALTGGRNFRRRHENKRKTNARHARFGRGTKSIDNSFVCSSYYCSSRTWFDQRRFLKDGLKL